MTKESRISKNMLVGTVVKRYPDSVEILLEHGIQCIGCHVATWETLEQAAKSNFVDAEALVKELNHRLN